MSEHSTTLSTSQSSPPVERQERPASRINVGEPERWLSVIGGGALVLYGLRRSLGSLALAAGGGMLIYRGVTGHCKVYESLGLNSVSLRALGLKSGRPLQSTNRLQRSTGFIATSRTTRAL
jgi:hypothetical protein